MSAGVLAVMYAQATREFAVHFKNTENSAARQRFEAMRKAGAIVAELIDADIEFDAAHENLLACPAPLSLNQSGLVKQAARDAAKARVKAATARRAAALAKAVKP